MKRKIVMGMLMTASMFFCFSMGNEAEAKVKLNPDKPEILTIWHYYNGMQQQNFDNLVLQFNETIGSEEGIILEAHSKGSVNELSDALLASANKEVGSEEMPDIFAAYPDTAYELNEMGLAADLSDYFTQEEKDSYMDSYIKEGDLDQNGSLKLFPVAKSTEAFLLNETDWEKFAAETGAQKDKFATWEGIVETAKAFYEWTDAQTPDIEHDGKAFFGRDAFANYMLVGCAQLGAEMFEVENGEISVQLDKDVIRRLWDCYYVPYVNGWFGSYGKFRSDDIKTGQLISLVGSTSGALYFPTEVTQDDGTMYSIECGVYPLPNFEGEEPYAVQQGAGLVVSRTTEEKEYAASLFLKWFTQTDHNIEFSINSGYLPVKKEANNADVLKEAMTEQDESSLFSQIILTGVDITSHYNLYTPTVFKNANTVRKVAEYSMPDAAAQAAAKRDEMVASGTSWEDAVSQLTDDAAFEEWYASFEEAVNDAVG